MPTVQNALQKCLTNIIVDMSRQMDARKRNASKRSVNSLKLTIENLSSQIRGTVWGEKQWLYMEQGRKAGAVPKGFVKIIQQWIIDKKIHVTPKPYIQPKRGKGFTPQERGLKSLAGAIAYKIKTKGTRLYRNGVKDDIYSSAIEKNVSIMMNEISTSISISIDKISDHLKN